jgi:acyl transferase domain-containing protein
MGLSDHRIAGESSGKRFSKPKLFQSIRKAIQPSSTFTKEPIAIIGLSCRFPQAPKSAGFWELLRNGVDAISEVPPTAGMWTPSIRIPAPGKVTSASGGFLDNVDLFDPHFFGISPREAARMDPQQRLFLK